MEASNIKRINDSSIIINVPGKYHIVGNGQETANNILVNVTGEVEISIENICIKSDLAFYIQNGFTKLTLIGKNSLNSVGDKCAGLRVAANSTLEITQASKNGQLTAVGKKGSYAFGGAAIGSNRDEKAGNIIINGGVIQVTQGDCAACIGGGHKGTISRIEINGGHILTSAHPGMGDPAIIGPGGFGEGGTIVINGGTIISDGLKKIGRGNSSVQIFGGSIDADIIESAPNNKFNRLIKIEKTISPNTSVTKLAGAGVFGLNDVVSNNNGKVFLWLPQDTLPENVKINTDNWENTPTRVKYDSFELGKLDMYAWKGNKTVLLTQNANLEASVIKKLVNAMDATYEFYHMCTGYAPTIIPEKHIMGLATVAEVKSTCGGQGAGCGYIGATGIELQTKHFDYIYSQLKEKGQYDQALFYEYGRNFFYYMDQIAYNSNNSIRTGYAVFMRFQTMEYNNLPGAPFNGNLEFSQFKQDVKDLINLYLKDKNLNWENTLGSDKGVPGHMGGTDLFASFCFYLKEHYGNWEWVKNVWKYVGQMAKAENMQQAASNFIIASSLAGNTNLCDLFKSWRWPVPNELYSQIDNQLNH